MHNLYAFFIAQGLLFNHPGITGEVLAELKPDGDALLVSSNTAVFESDAERREKVKQSGVHLRITSAPDLVQTLYLLALAEYRGSSYSKRNVPFASRGKFDLRFVRTATVLNLGSEEKVAGVAYVPREAIFIYPFAKADKRAKLLSMDAFVIA